MQTETTSPTFAGGKQVDKTSYWIEEKDGNGFPVKHLNFNNPQVCPRKGLIVLEPMRVQRGTNGSKKHSAKLSHKRFIDNSTGTPVVAGIPVRIERTTGEFIYQQILLTDIETLDLSIEADAKKWAVLRLSPLLYGSPNVKNNRPEYKTYDREREAEIKLLGRQKKREATMIAEGLAGEDLTDMCRVSGINVTGLSHTRLQVAIIDYAEEHYQTFLDNYYSPVRQQNFIFKRALDLDVIEQDPVHGFKFRELPLGQTEPQAVEYLREHSSTSAAIQAQTQLKEKESVKEANKVVSPKIADDKDVLLNEQAKEIEALRKRLQDSEQVKIDEEYKNSNSKTLSEFDMLKAEAKELGVKSWHLKKTVEQLQKAIAEHKAANN